MPLIIFVALFLRNEINTSLACVFHLYVLSYQSCSAYVQFKIRAQSKKAIESIETFS